MKILRVIAFWIFLALCYYFCHSLANSHFRNRHDNIGDEEEEEGNNEQGSDNPGGGDSSTPESRAIRKTFISNTLITKKVVVPTKMNRTKTNSTAKEIEKKRIENITPLAQIVGDSTESNQLTKDLSSSLLIPAMQSIQLKHISNKTCFICLCEYEETDIICSSPNADCVHIFHRDCIMEWLMRHDECPCCRTDYLEVNNRRKDEMNTDSNDNDPTDVEMGISIAINDQQEVELGSGNEGQEQSQHQSNNIETTQTIPTV